MRRGDSDSGGSEQKRPSVVFVTVLVVIGVLFTLVSLVGTLLSAPETWHRFAGFVSRHTAFMSDEQLAILRIGLLLVGSCIAGFALGRTRRDRSLNKWLTGTALLFIGAGIALTGAAAIEELDRPAARKVGISDARVVARQQETKGNGQAAADAGGGATDSAETIEASTGSSGSGFEASASTDSSCACPVPVDFTPESGGGSPAGSSTETVEVTRSESQSSSESGSTASSESTVESSSSSESSASSSSSSRSESQSESESSSEVVVE